MRFQYLVLTALLAVGVSAPVWAQNATAVSPDTVVARLMSFDRNADGRITAHELPERMQSLLARGDSSSDGILDGVEIRRLAMSPAPQFPIRNVLQVGRYGFSESFSESSQHIDGAIDDLRLASDTRERARYIVRTFRADAEARARSALVTTMVRLLTDEQLDDFQAAIDGEAVSVPAVRRGDGVTIFGALPEESAGLEKVTVRLRVSPAVNLESYIAKYVLEAEDRQQAIAAIRHHKELSEGRLNDAERSALVEELGAVLTGEQRDDLRAALGRRPIVQLTGVVRLSEQAAIVPPGPVTVQGNSAVLLERVLSR